MKEMYNHEEYIKQNKRQGKGRWRLPKIEELLSIVDYTTHNPASGIDITSNFYWSSTTTAGYTSSAWGVYFGVGYSGYHSKTCIMYIRCIRDTENGLEWGEDASTKMSWHEAMEYAESLNV